MRAAEMVGITQPAVSRLLRDLQARLDLTLFTRDGPRLVPTAEALALYDEVQRSFVGLARIAEAARELRAGRAGTLRVAVMPALANGFLPRFAGGFLARRPGLGLHLQGLISHLVLDHVATGQCEIGFASPALRHPAVVTRPLPSTRMVAVLPPGHRLARRKVLRPRDFEGEEFISFAPGATARHEVDDVFARAAVARRMRTETPLSEVLCGLVAGGAGVGLVDVFTAREYERAGIVMRSFEPFVPNEFVLAHAAGRSPSAVAEEFAAEFEAHVRREAADWLL